MSECTELGPTASWLSNSLSILGLGIMNTIFLGIVLMALCFVVAGCYSAWEYGRGGWQ